MELRLTRDEVANTKWPDRISNDLQSDWLALYSQHEADAKALAEKDAMIRELAESAFLEIATETTEGKLKGWWDSCARREACDAGDKLVELGLWEIHPTAGYGRRQFYRPIKRPPATGEGR